MTAVAHFSQGAAANHGGQALEDFVRNLAAKYKFRILRSVDDAGNADMFNANLLVENVPYQNIFGSKSRSEFLLIRENLWRRIRIECKWQQEAGSCDEKLVSLYMNAALAMPEDEIILLIDGGGARDYVINTIKQWSKSRRFFASKVPKNITVMTMAEFQAWFHRFMRGQA